MNESFLELLTQNGTKIHLEKNVYLNISRRTPGGNYFYLLEEGICALTSITKKGEEYTADNIEEYPYIEQIMSSLKNTLKAFKKQKEPDTIELEGIYRQVSFNEEMFTDIMNSDDPVKNFSEFVTSIQKIKAARSWQRIHLATYIGVYTLTESVRTILPYKPAVDEENKQILIRDEMIEYWDINLVVIEGNPENIKSYRVLGSIRYSDFIEKLPKDKYKFIDAGNILVEGLSRQEIENLLV